MKQQSKKTKPVKNAPKRAVPKKGSGTSKLKRANTKSETAYRNLMKIFKEAKRRRREEELRLAKLN